MPLRTGMRASFRFLGTPWVLDDVFKEIDFDLDGEIEGDELWEWCRGVRADCDLARPDCDRAVGVVPRRTRPSPFD